MFGYECFREDNLTWVRHVDTGHVIRYHSKRWKTELEVDDFEYIHGADLACQCWEEWLCMGKTMRSIIAKETLERNQMMNTYAVADGKGGYEWKGIDQYGSTLVDCVPLPPMPEEKKACYKVKTPIKKDIDMGYGANAIAAINNPRSEESKQRDYLKDRLYSLNSQKVTDLRVKFNMDAPKGPKSMKDLIDRIKNDKFQMPKNEDSLEYTWYSSRDLMDQFDWRLTPADKPGFEAAEVLLDKAYTEAADAIMIKTPVEGLDAVKAFETLVI